MVTEGLLDPNDTGKISETLVTVANVKRPMVTESNPMGQIRAGVLSLRGRCLWAMLRLSEVRPSEHVLEVRCLTGFRAIPRYVASELTPSNARAPNHVGLFHWSTGSKSSIHRDRDLNDENGTCCYSAGLQVELAPPST
jgi:hypothetical protein